MKTSIAEKVRQKINSGGKRLWRVEDFRPLPARAVARELSRLERAGKIFRVRKGVYRKERGELSVREALDDFSFPLQPARQSAAHVLGLAPAPSRPVWATTARVRPAIEGTVLLGRPKSRAKLSPEEAACLEFLRDRGRYAESSAGDCIMRVRRLLGDSWEKLLPVALQEPPRVRAILGALGEGLGMPEKDLWRLRRTLNPLTSYQGGIFSSLPEAPRWQIL